jgi:hypothetical protein
LFCLVAFSSNRGILNIRLPAFITVTQNYFKGRFLMRKCFTAVDVPCEDENEEYGEEISLKMAMDVYRPHGSYTQAAPNQDGELPDDLTEYFIGHDGDEYSSQN